jgi:hypothetical protein
MARRGALTALQAVLAGISGGAGGYIQQEEMKRKRMAEEEDKAQRELTNLLTLSREPLVSSGPLATRAPAQVTPPKLEAGAPPSIVPMQPRGDFRTAMQALEQEEQRPSGTIPFTVGGQTLNVAVGQRRADILRSQAIQTARETAEAEAEARLAAARPGQEALADTVAGFSQLTPQLRQAVQSGAMTLSQALDQVKPNDEKTVGGIPEASVRVAGGLRDDWRAEPSVKRAETIADQTRIVRAAAKNPDAAGDLSLIFAYMRVLDPTSVVREREFANAQNAAGVPDQIRNLYNRVLSGERLNETQRNQFVSRSTEIAKQSDISLQRQVRRYTNIANKYGIDPEMVIDNPFEGLFDAEAPAPTAGGGSARDRLRARATGGRP